MDIETRKKISRAMKGKSNFEGKRHTHASKIQIKFSMEGHRNAKDHKWVTDKETGEEHRVKGNLPKGMRWGRSPSSFNENFMDGRNPEDKGDMARHGLKNKTMAQLRKIRGSGTASPRQKQLAHWYINMHKEEKEVWDDPSPAKKPDRLSSVMKARAKARARAAGRPYPNLIDNMWAARNEGKDSAKRLEGTDSLKKIYTDATPGQGKKVKVDEAKATYCGRCGTTHVAPKFGGTCPALRKEEVGQVAEVSMKTLQAYRQQAHTQIQHYKLAGGKDKPEASSVLAKREPGLATATAKVIQKDKERIAAQPKPAPRKAEPYKPLGGRDETSGRSYSESKSLQGVAEGLLQTLRRLVPGHAKREINKKMDAGKFGRTDADKDANFQRYKKIQDKLK